MTSVESPAVLAAASKAELGFVERLWTLPRVWRQDRSYLGDSVELRDQRFDVLAIGGESFSVRCDVDVDGDGR
jgi:hypothetical protein